MSKDIANGIHKIAGKKVPNPTELDLYYRTWRDIRNKLDSSLLRTNVLKGDVIRQLCQSLDSQDLEKRYQTIVDNWGPQQAEKSRPLLEQLAKIEAQISTLTNQ
jgi:hypothetical protein